MAAREVRAIEQQRTARLAGDDGHLVHDPAAHPGPVVLGRLRGQRQIRALAASPPSPLQVRDPAATHSEADEDSPEPRGIEPAIARRRPDAANPRPASAAAIPRK